MESNGTFIFTKQEFLQFIQQANDFSINCQITFISYVGGIRYLLIRYDKIKVPLYAELSAVSDNIRHA